MDAVPQCNDAHVHRGILYRRAYRNTCAQTGDTDTDRVYIDVDTLIPRRLADVTQRQRRPDRALHDGMATYAWTLGTFEMDETSAWNTLDIRHDLNIQRTVRAEPWSCCSGCCDRADTHYDKWSAIRHSHLIITQLAVRATHSLPTSSSTDVDVCCAYGVR